MWLVGFEAFTECRGSRMCRCAEVRLQAALTPRADFEKARRVHAKGFSRARKNVTGTGLGGRAQHDVRGSVGLVAFKAAGCFQRSLGIYWV